MIRFSSDEHHRTAGYEYTSRAPLPLTVAESRANHFLHVQVDILKLSGEYSYFIICIQTEITRYAALIDVTNISGLRYATKLPVSEAIRVFVERKCGLVLFLGTFQHY